MSSTSFFQYTKEAIMDGDHIPNIFNVYYFFKMDMPWTYMHYNSSRTFGCERTYIDLPIECTHASTTLLFASPWLIDS